MANRSYLYSMNRSHVKKSDISEANNEVPLFHIILLGIETEITKSWIWKDYEFPIAFIGDFRKGLKRYITLLEHLKIVSPEHKDIFDSYVKLTSDFFNQNPTKKSIQFLLEPGEIFELIADLESPKDQAVNLLDKIRTISDGIDSFLAIKKKNLTTEAIDIPIISELLKDPTSLKPHWQEVCYYSFNHSRASSYKNKNNNHLYANTKS